MRFLLGAETTLSHLVLGVAVGALAKRTEETLVALRVAAVAHRVIEVPAGARATAGRSSSTVTAYATVLNTGVNARCKYSRQCKTKSGHSCCV